MFERAATGQGGAAVWGVFSKMTILQRLAGVLRGVVFVYARIVIRSIPDLHGQFEIGIGRWSARCIR
ncbi:hypothetical protein [Pseudophaeobacter sp.]|uniref:hypothetical protein n=1 Tax=Pseudophaeobacter sp. TaxID=1971739 RepID=UPI003A97DF77